MSAWEKLLGKSKSTKAKVEAELLEVPAAPEETPPVVQQPKTLGVIRNLRALAPHLPQ